MWVNHVCFGVLDIDSLFVTRFDGEDREGLEAFVRILEKANYTN